jgi:hypothetical protein
VIKKCEQRTKKTNDDIKAFSTTPLLLLLLLLAILLGRELFIIAIKKGMEERRESFDTEKLFYRHES